MVKKICALVVVLLLLLPAACLAAQAHVIDECGLFTEQQIAEMEEQIEEIRSTYEMDCVILTTRRVPRNRDDYSEDQTQAFADRYYEENGYGLGEDRAGILYVIDMNNRVSYVSTAGVMIDYIDDDRKEELLNSADEELYQGRYGRAALALIGSLKSILGRGIEEGHFRYDDVTGERLSGLYNKLTTGEILAGAAIGIGAAATLFFAVMARYNLTTKTYKFNKATQSSVSLTRDEKTFLRSKVTRARISSGGGGGRGMGGGGGHGSGVHISSGGMSHGGGGHHF